MTALNRDQLLREASVLKMRATRLRALGDVDEQWQSVVLLHHAAQKELAALAALKSPSEQDQMGARIEACGLFLDAKDPVRAAEQWRLLPPSVFTSNSNAMLLEEVQQRYETLVGAFTHAWRSLKGTPGVPEVSSLRVEQLRSLTTKYPGVAELWWALSRNAQDSTARDRMLELSPSLAKEEAAKAAWERVEEVLVRKFTLTMKAEKQGIALPLELVNRIADAFGAVLSDFAERTFGAQVELLPTGSRIGSYIVDIAAQGLPPYALHELIRELALAEKRIDIERLVELLALLQQNSVKLTVAEVPQSERTARLEEPATLVIDQGKRTQLIEAAEAASLRNVDSRDVPQADNLERVFHMVEMAVMHKPFDAEILGITPRQVLYYRRAAQILGLLTESDEVTAAGRLIARLSPEDRLRASVVHFESSRCGDAWIQWSQGRTLLDVDPDSAYKFLRECVPGLSENTAARRVKTLNSWHRILCTYHYGAVSLNS